VTVWICQCLCPDRHCILAAAGEADTVTQAESAVRTPLRRKTLELLRDQTFNPWCALCGANRATWKYELRRTRFATMEEANPHLHETEAANMATNAAWGDIHKTTRPFRKENFDAEGDQNQP
jgi:hypothetical protein